MKKLFFTTAAAVAILAAPFAGKADAAQIQPVQTKVVYYQLNASNLSDINVNQLYNQILKNYQFNWDVKQYNQPVQQKPVQQKPVQQQVQQKPVQQKPVQQKPVQKPVQQQEKPAGSNSQLSAFEQQVFDLTNQERVKNGLAPLKVDLELSKVAREKSRDMSANKYFDHNSPTYGSPFDMMKKFGITYRSAGENIAMGQPTPQDVVNAWMNSSGHRANILNSGFTHIGIGHDANGNYWTQQFIGK